MFSSAEAGKAANVLWGNATKLDSAIEQMGDSAGAANEAFEKMGSTGEYVEQKWENSLNNLKIAIGNAEPSLDGLMTKGTEIVNSLSAFIEENPEAVAAVSGITVAVGAFTAAMVAHSAATLVAEKATLALTAALDTNPVFLAVTAVAACIYA
jgi:TP901 family phage tail tape measure protein